MSAPKLSRLGTAALGYAKHGIPVFPCEPQGKAPLTGNGFKDATTDPARIVEWWTATPNANIGGVVGAAGYVVVDCDDPERGEPQARALGLLAEPAPTVTTGRGWHRYYRANGTAVRPQRLSEGLEIKGQGGYFILPPSRHPTGALYRWAGPEKLTDAPPLPPRVVEALAAPPTPAPVADDTPATIHEGERNCTLTSLAGSMRRPGMTPEEIAAGLLEVNTRRCRPPLSEAEVRKIAGSVAQYEPAADNEDTASPRPIILIRPKLTGMTDEAIAAIAGRPDLGIYVRGRMLVTVARDGSRWDRWLRRPPGAPVIVPIGPSRMLGLLDEAVQWQKWNERDKAAVPAMPPDRVAAQVLGRLEWPLPYLDAVIETPTLRPDGSVLASPGWDEATGLLYEPMPGTTWPAVPDHPTSSQVREAVDVLMDPVQDFPFVAGSDRSAYLAAVLTLVARHMIDGPVPLFAIRAPTPGTGKTLLGDVIGLGGAGRIPPAMTMSYETEELRKRITALAVAGTAVVLLDNLSGPLGSDVLAAALTKREWEDRVLGVNQMVRVPLTTVWLATGNNLAFRRTLARRVVPIDLDAKLEQPEDRTDFRHADLLAYVRHTRPQLVTAALTVLRGFHVAQRPAHGGARMGSFESWDDLIRSAVVWAGLEDPAGANDPAAGRGRVRSQADEDTETLAALLAALHRAFPGGKAFTSAAVMQQAETDEILRRDLDLAAPAKTGKVTVLSLGYALRAATDRPCGSLTLRAGTGKRPRTYQVLR